MIFSRGNQVWFSKAQECCSCEKQFIDGDEVRDHCHVTGKYRGAADKDYKMNARVTNTLFITKALPGMHS